MSADVSKTVTVELEDNQILLLVSVSVEHEDGDWEYSTPGYFYAFAQEPTIVDDSLDERTAALLYAEFQGGDPFPDGAHPSHDEIDRVFLERWQASVEKKADPIIVDLED